MSDEILRMVEELRRNHHICEDPWYSCPLSEEGCGDTSWPEDECNCGADIHNALVEIVLQAIQHERSQGG